MPVPPKTFQAREANGAEFIGLFRSEFLFQDFDQEPDEDQQLAAYQEALGPSGATFPVTVRLLDVGGDKPLKFLPQPKEANPFLGVRGIRLLMANQRFFRAHLRAILRLADSFQVHLLIPMITDVSEILATRKMLAEIAGELSKGKRASPMANPGGRNDRDTISRASDRPTPAAPRFRQHRNQRSHSIRPVRRTRKRLVIRLLRFASPGGSPNMRRGDPRSPENRG